MFDFLFKKRERLPLPYSREIHCHLIPGVDDGAAEMGHTINHLRSLQDFGVEKVIFTPHHTEPNYMNTPAIIRPLFEDVKAAIQGEGLSIEAEDFSFEYRLDESFLQMSEKGAWGEPDCVLRPLRDRYLLIENAWQQPLAGLDDLIYRLQERGFYLVMAHPERYAYYYGRKGRDYQHLQDMQVEFQCNMLSFAGYYGDDARKAAYWMLEHECVNFLGSDMHNQRHVELLEKFLRTKDYASIREDLISMIQNDRM